MRQSREYPSAFDEVTTSPPSERQRKRRVNGNGNGGGSGGNGGRPPIDPAQRTCGNGILVPPNGSYSCIGLTWHTSLMPTPGDTGIAEGVHLIR